MCPALLLVYGEVQPPDAGKAMPVRPAGCFIFQNVFGKSVDFSLQDKFLCLWGEAHWW